ncbi:MAG: hypothetical protein COU06_01895, partial [Candidatus Harrisonbacteria bacterium CG10_big_fil_rev_8_21_14_0_10_38_8]
MKAVGEIPWSVGLLTTSRVGGRLSEALQNQQNGWWKNCHQLQTLFTERELRAAACQVQPPRWNLLEAVFAEQNLSE